MQPEMSDLEHGETTVLDVVVHLLACGSYPQFPLG